MFELDNAREWVDWPERTRFHAWQEFSAGLRKPVRRSADSHGAKWVRYASA